MRKALLLALLAGIAGFVAIDAAKDKPEGGNTPAREARTGSADGHERNAGPASTEVRTFALPERSSLAESGSSLFSSQSWQPPRAPKVSAPAPAPVAPPLPYKFVGKLVQDGRRTVYLAKGDSVFPVGQGETLDGTYKVESISDAQIVLIYLPLGQTHTIPVVTSLATTAPVAAAPAGPAPVQPGAGAPIPTRNVIAPPPPRTPATGAATLAWGGPQQVKLGARFDVTLSVSSKQPLHAWPMQLRVDPAHFEVVSVKPGKLQGGADPNFSYRVNPDGSIFIGASVNNAAAAMGTELLALTLRTLKSGKDAEVSVAALNLQGASGRPIPHDHISSLKIAIAP